MKLAVQKKDIYGVKFSTKILTLLKTAYLRFHENSRQFATFSYKFDNFLSS